MQRGIIIFQKNAELGKVKTRLAETMGKQEALEIYQILVNYTHQNVQQVPYKKLLYFSEFLEKSTEWENEFYSHKLQIAGNLGVKMANAFQTEFENGFNQLVIIGTDCPEINPEIIEEAFEKLTKVDVVLGPATDGGYYLLGMNQFISGLFKDIPWSSEVVLAATKNFLVSNGITFDMLPLLSDVDYQEDWEKVKERLLKTQE
ncbi:TIGR04282 family arsenosugar biosynthesis glycosyltransferase [Algoriphagus pacificus]|uniref:TIGR04282 family arsenosugar biosynthesis glycosyltransferase n=1 Tax=Algoriphagus pacificus TaxID=2811234 RepID=A0ABS3CKD9_9BACT|nr:TIGR04282 family arsenosugar biosynthesis glycosyltransferase [Algoriphagus pacificus]MBN7816700.1 TIGR04282 family arsenosugar biosynthesis glycosyltransferase [Algoriphagus pacificus]